MNSTAAGTEAHPRPTTELVRLTTASPDDSVLGAPATPGTVGLRPIAKRRSPTSTAPWVAWMMLVDAVCLMAGWALTASWLGEPVDVTARGAALTAFAAVFVLSGLLAMRVAHLYQLDVVVDSLAQTTAVLRAGALHFIVCLASAEVLALALRPAWMVTTSAVSILLLCTLRALGRRSAVARCANGALLRRVLLVGTDDDALAFRRTVLDHPETGLQVVAVAGAAAPSWVLGAGVVWVGDGVGDALRAIERFEIDAVFIVPAAVEGGQLTRLRRVMAELHVPVHVVHTSASVAGSRLRQTRVGLDYLTHVEIEPVSRLANAVKRATDLGLGLLVTVIALPVMAAVAVAILVLDGRPVFFRQTRVGRDLHPFRLIKFRTMAPDAEHRVSELAHRNERQGPLFKVSDDPRVTRIGKLLRASSLDELPQLFNVLAGHMSLVGPRPAMPAEVVRFSPELRSRHRMRPGVTGLWQVRSRDETSFESYQSLDLFYVENWSLAMDLAILAATGPAVVARALSEVRRARVEHPRPLKVDRGVTPLRSESV